MTTSEFIRLHRNDDIRMLALKSGRHPDVDFHYALQQIAGWQTARKKIPSWAAVEGIIYPPSLALEQCSSDGTAQYKADIVKGIKPQLLIDLTGGMGVDHAAMAKHCLESVYVEQQEQLCMTARHNFRQLLLTHTTVVNSHAEQYLERMGENPTAETMIFADPARRDSHGKRTFGISDCQPNLLELKPLWMNRCRHFMFKLSPMLDIHKAVDDLNAGTNGIVSEVHIVAIGNECKELLIVGNTNGGTEQPTITCSNLSNVSITFNYTDSPCPILNQPPIPGRHFLYEPHATLMKAGCFGQLCQRFQVTALAPNSHLFVSDQLIRSFPGRIFHIDNITTLNKPALRHAMSGVTHANVAVRNFPMSADQLRKRLKITDGGSLYIFGSTLADGQHTLILCQRGCQ